MKKRYSLFIAIAFGLLCFIQLGVIGFQVMTYERILKEGEAFYFDILPLDPYDPFRGRYVTIRFNRNILSAPLVGDVKNIERQGKAYAILEHSKEGDKIKEIRLSRPQNGVFLEVEELYMGEIAEAVDQGKKKIPPLVYFSLPFDRFYMREDLAPKAENILRRSRSIEGEDERELSTKAKIKVLNGKGVIEDLTIDDQPITQYLLSH